MSLPTEWSFGGLYLPPMLLATIVGCTTAAVVARIASRFGLIRYVWHPWLAFVGLAVLFSALVGLFLIRAA